MAQYDDVLQFLTAHEENTESQMNDRTPLSVAEISEIRNQYPSIPEDYLDYLTEVGWGAFRECQYAVYRGLIDPSDIFDTATAASFQKRVLCFGDNFAGDPGGFLPDENWAVVEIWHDSLDIYETNKSFGRFIREKMMMDESGNDLSED